MLMNYIYMFTWQEVSECVNYDPCLLQQWKVVKKILCPIHTYELHMVSYCLSSDKG